MTIPLGDLPGSHNPSSREAGLRINGPGRPSSPIRSCSAWGLPCPRCRHRGGGLLLHLFTLAWGVAPALPGARPLPDRAARRFILCGAIRSRPMSRPGPPLVLLPSEQEFGEHAALGVRTFLPAPPKRNRAITRLTRQRYYTSAGSSGPERGRRNHYALASRTENRPS